MNADEGGRYVPDAAKNRLASKTTINQCRRFIVFLLHVARRRSLQTCKSERFNIMASRSPTKLGAI
jgi:hypothetical protein